MPHTVQCPTCKRPVAWLPQNKWRPFCSERCKLIDLGEWAAEKRAISSDAGSINDPETDEPEDAS